MYKGIRFSLSVRLSSSIKIESASNDPVPGFPIRSHDTYSRYQRALYSGLVLSLGLSSAVSTQEVTGTISGTVKDTSVGAVSGATVH